MSCRRHFYIKLNLASKITFLNNLIAKNPSAQLTIISGLSGLIYLFVFTLRFPLTGYFNTIPPVDYTKLTHYSQSGLIAYVVGIGVLFWLYVSAFRIAMPSIDDRRSTVKGHFIFLSSTALAAISIFAYPLTAIDLFIYAIRTRGWALYGLNPLATAPETLPVSDPWLGLAAEWVDAPSPYGPVWEWLSLGTFYAGGGDFLSQLLALKILLASFYLGCVWLVYKILRQLAPQWVTAGTVAFAWNPLILLESVQNGHNDIVMTFFLLAAIWVFVIRQENPHLLSSWKSALLAGLICLFLALSILVKFVTIIIVPFFLLSMSLTQPRWLRRIASIALYGLIIAVLVVLSMHPLWPGWDDWAVLSAGSQAGRSLLALLVLGFRDSVGTNTAFDVSRNLIAGGFVLVYLYFLWPSLKAVVRPQPVALDREPQQSSPTPSLPISQSFFSLFWYVLLVAPVFHAWYLLWFAPLAVLLLPDQRPLIATTVFSITALLIIPYFETIRVWYPYLLHNHFVGHLIGVPLLIVPPAIALLWSNRPRIKPDV